MPAGFGISTFRKNPGVNTIVSIETRRFHLGSIISAALLSLFLNGVFFPASAQEVQRVVHAQSRVFPEIGAGVTAIEQDAAGRFYILARPATFIRVLDAQGNPIGRIPAADAPSARIVYAEDFDLDSSGRILVADRGANAVEIFLPDGRLVTSIHIFAPTSVVALPGGQFAVTTLRSTRLVEIRDQNGKLIRKFGELADAGVDPAGSPESLRDIGRLSGDSAGNLYFAFSTLTDPTFRKYDRFGYASAEATVPSKEFFQYSPREPDDRVQVGMSFTETNLSDQVSAWTMLGSTGDIQFGGGLGTGFGGRMGGGPMSAESATEGILSTSFAGAGTNAPGGGQGGYGNGGTGGNLSARGSYQFGTLDLHLGLGLGRPRNASGNKGSSGSNSSGTASSTDSPSDAIDGALNFDTSDMFGDESSSDTDLSNLEQVFSPGDAGSPNGMGSSMHGGMHGGEMGTHGMGMGGLGPGLFLANSGLGFAGGTFLPGGFGGGFFSQRFNPASGSSGSTAKGSPASPPLTGASAFGASGAKGVAGAHPFGPGLGHYGGPHGRFGPDLYNITGIVKVNLGHSDDAAQPQPRITAMAVDPATHEIWEAVGNSLVHFDRGGNFMGMYYISTPEGAPFVISALLVEPKRILMGSEARGIFSLPRPDKASAGAAGASLRLAAPPEAPQP